MISNEVGRLGKRVRGDIHPIDSREQVEQEIVIVHGEIFQAAMLGYQASIDTAYDEQYQ